MTHACHANGCESPDLHAEVPFCKKHWDMLPEPHQKKLWKGRVRGGCGLCEHHDEAHPEWLRFVHLGIALLCLLEYGEHDCPESLLDEQGFCWGCGVQGVPKVYRQAKKIAEKYKLKVRS